MKVIFLDLDGVLNTDRYLKQRDPVAQGCIDETKIPLLLRILEETGAVIVLSTSWRLYWDPDPALCAPEWWAVGESLARFGLRFYERTPAYNGNHRDREVRDWLDAHKGEVESFVILDDIHFGWGDLADRLVHTSPLRGLTEALADEAIAVLRTPVAGWSLGES